MPTWTVITVTDRHHPDHIGAVQGHADVAGHNVHTAVVTAGTADDAINTVREAFRVVGAHRVTANPDRTPHADQWTVVGVAGNGVCASHTVVAVIAGKHEVEGSRDSMVSHRWTQVVDAPDAQAAEEAGYKAATDVYADTWD